MFCFPLMASDSRYWGFLCISDGLVETGEGRTPRPEGTANGCTTDISGALFSFYETSAGRVSVKPADSLEPNHNGIRRAASRKFGARIPAFGNNRERT